ncbi:Formylglycine-generating sulfatase enzyme [Crateriforma conspicua]|uniref:Formylglycine-generating sulfatase enzyme n=2 Tax=Crateriforma conspicua TaxID=2527996 RepID=A0A5C5Y872_9PLAN|nr:Formylglycine-generating sulfatase enzyme [Crateriforma conspicua]
MIPRPYRISARTLVVLAVLLVVHAMTAETCPSATPNFDRQCDNLRSAVEHLRTTYGHDYPRGDAFLKRLDELRRKAESDPDAARSDLVRLRREALLDHPRLTGDLLMVRRRAENPIHGIAVPAPHETMAGYDKTGYDNDVVRISLDDIAADRAQPPMDRFFRPDDGGFIGDLRLHYDADRLLVTRSDAVNWKLWEIGVDDQSMRPVTTAPDDVDCFDGCYLPDGRIIFASTASYQSVPCHHGQMPTGNLYRCNADGSDMRQLCFDQDIDANPVVLPSGQVMYSRWDYVGINHIFLRELMVMNPDGTGQRAIYGSNSYFPNSLFFSQPLPGSDHGLVSILSGYHGAPRMGWLVTLDPSKGWQNADGIIHRISGQGTPVLPVIRDTAIDPDWPKFLHPQPISDKFFLVSMLRDRRGKWEIYLADVFDNVVRIAKDDQYHLLEPTPVQKRATPPVIADRTDPQATRATVYLHDVHAGPGLDGVPRGTVQRLRVLSYHFGYRQLAGPDKIGYGGPWDSMQIEGTVDVESDGSAMFEVPANTPLAVQPLDEKGRAVQLMRSWFTAMPGEVVSCVGCHEKPLESAASQFTLAATKPPQSIRDWYGPPRGFDFQREVQPVLDHHCAGCHDGQSATPDLRTEDAHDDLATWPIGYVSRLHPDMHRDTGGRMTYTPAYDALVHYIRRVGIEDSVEMLTPGEYHAETSPLIQMLRRGHHGVKLDTEAWDRLVTWIDLNGPCHGTWSDVYPVPDDAKSRRRDLQLRYGGPARDPEHVPPTPPYVPLAKGDTGQRTGDDGTTSKPSRTSPASGAASAVDQRSISMPDGSTLMLVKIQPAGSTTAYWMASTEITNAQYQAFDPEHRSRFYAHRLDRPDGPGVWMGEDSQPVVRVSRDEAMAFCRWLSTQTSLEVRLPTDRQWTLATGDAAEAKFWFGDQSDDFAPYENLADASFGRGVMSALKVHPPDVTQWSGGVPHLVLEGGKRSASHFSDGAVVTTAVGSFQANPLGMHDMHGNVAEWLLPDSAAQGDNAVAAGGSFFDPPSDATAAMRRTYARWQKIFNVGFRIVVTFP